ncbi:MAG: type I glyceraldehyde-3-phosphate dehydrogenase [Patescibacteria group bacterium]
MKIAINGFGRIGRQAFKIALDKPDVEVVAVNDIASPRILAHLLKYDTAYGMFPKEIKLQEDGSLTDSEGREKTDDHFYKAADSLPKQTYLIVDDKKTLMLNQKDPALLPWKDLGVDVVLECTGRLTKDGASQVHITAGAKKVVVSAPVSGEGEVQTFLLGVNDASYMGQNIISNASCTTNCIAPVVKVINDNFGIIKSTMTTIHAVTAEQNLVDGALPGIHADLRRARAGVCNMIPTTTGAAKAVGEVIPSLKGIFDGLAVRVPVITGSLSDVTMLVAKKTTAQEINQAFLEAEKNPEYKGVLQTTFEPIVSSDIIGNTHSAIVDLSLTKVVDGDLVKVVAWYDNEWGYSNRLVEMALLVGA